MAKFCCHLFREEFHGGRGGRGGGGWGVNCQGLVVQGGIIQRKMFGLKSPGRYCSGGSFMGVVVQAGKLFRGNSQEGKNPEDNFLRENFIGGSCSQGSCVGGNIRE